ncbi:MFS transporter [Stenotrophomonas sp. BIO128-Bstrain]|jgi:DHA2 family multidrug resistance protein-like MFS transporter|uniref:MFS transporter n=1 Tax=Stenotrophomonas sp. BIO128-Bstrain TaxID=3027225 RepID=UPI0024DEA3C6|nr:MFS transporter [Stenotrophomonas sp. BIO128-Bstrain]WIA63398.1 MFS transporter [Stenotrophomonas sp. BIO128-Bstrain]
MTPTKTQRWSLLLTVAAGLLLITLDNSVLYTALPTLTAELGATSLQGLWIINAYPLVMAGLLLGAGTLGDRLGHRRMFLIGLVIFGIASLLAAFAADANLLIGARALLAVGAAAMMPATLALISLTFADERERNLAIAVWGCISIIGSAIGPIVGGVLLAHFWWGSVFLINVPIVLLAMVGAVLFAPHGTPDASKPWDLISSLLSLVALSGLVVAIKEIAHAPPNGPLAAGAALVFVVGLVLFLRRQRRLPYPMLDVAIFRNAPFLAGVLSAAFAMFAIAGLQLLTTQRFQLVADYTPLQAGLLVSVVALGCLPSAIFGGAFLHRVGLLPLITGGLGVGTAGVLLVAVTFGSDLGWTITGLLLTGLGMGATISVASTAIIGNVPPHRAGMASSVEEVSYEFGSLFAVSLLGSLIAALYSATVSLPDGVDAAAGESIQQAFALAAQPGSDAGWLGAAASAYDASYVWVLYVIAAVLLVGTVVTGILLRRHGPGSATTVSHAH